MRWVVGSMRNQGALDYVLDVMYNNQINDLVVVDVLNEHIECLE
jgi:hypothetical protein